MKTLTLKNYKFIFDNDLKLIEVKKDGKKNKDAMFLLDKYLYVYSMIQSLIRNDGSVQLFGTKAQIDDLKTELNI